MSPRIAQACTCNKRITPSYFTYQSANKPTEQQKRQSEHFAFSKHLQCLKCLAYEVPPEFNFYCVSMIIYLS